MPVGVRLTEALSNSDWTFVCQKWKHRKGPPKQLGCAAHEGQFWPSMLEPQSAAAGAKSHCCAQVLDRTRLSTQIAARIVATDVPNPQT
jgi:hypothetical protein